MAAASVNELTLDEIKRFVTENGEKVPTLEEVLDSVGKRVKILVELKETGTEEQVLSLIRQEAAD